MCTNRRISPHFFQVFFIKQRSIQNCTERKAPKTKPEKQTKNQTKIHQKPPKENLLTWNSPDLKFSSESQMSKENSVVYVGANHGRGMWSQSVLLLVCCRKQFYNTPFYVDLKCVWVPGNTLKCCSIVRTM